MMGLLGGGQAAAMAGQMRAGAMQQHGPPAPYAGAAMGPPVPAGPLAPHGAGPAPGMGQRLMGLLSDPKMHIAMSLLESGGWQQQPVSFGQALGRAGMAGVNAMQMQQKMDLDRTAAKLKAMETVAKTRNYESQAEERDQRRGARQEQRDRYRDLIDTLDPEERKIFESMDPDAGAKLIAARREQSGDYETLYNQAGQPIGQRNIRTNRVSSHPFTTIATDPYGGNPFLVDREQMTAMPLPSPHAPPQPEVRERPQEQTIFGRIGDAVGARNWFTGEVYNRTLGQAFGADEKVAEARAELMGLRENVITALAKSGRPPVVEQQRILERFPDFGPGESVGAATAKLRSIYRDLEQVMEDDLAFAANPTAPAAQRREATARARAISETLSRMGPPPVPTGGQSEQLPGGVTLRWLPPDPQEGSQ